MTESQGKFTLFDVAEFGTWLNSATVNRVIKVVQNHHTLVPSYGSFHGDNHFSLLNGMEDYHITERGFAEIAQNLTTFPDGTIAVCRSLDTIPAGIKGANAFGICIENLGNFDLGKDAMSEEQRRSIVSVNAILCRKFSLQPDTDTIVYHHWYDLDTGARRDGLGNTKSCPGTNFFGGNGVPDAGSSFVPLVVLEFNEASSVQSVEPGTILFAGRVTSESLNVRDQPGTSGKKIKELYKGITVNAYEVSGTWCKIHPTEAHWVNRKYLEKIAQG